jgi:hypothetical protein
MRNFSPGSPTPKRALGRAVGNDTATASRRSSQGELHRHSYPDRHRAVVSSRRLENPLPDGRRRGRFLQDPDVLLFRVPPAGRRPGPSVPVGCRRMSTPDALVFGGQVTPGSTTSQQGDGSSPHPARKRAPSDYSDGLASRRACTRSTATSAGETPAMRAACPTVAGCRCPSFSRASRERPFSSPAHSAAGSSRSSSRADCAATRRWRSM